VLLFVKNEKQVVSVRFEESDQRGQVLQELFCHWFVFQIYLQALNCLKFEALDSRSHLEK